MISSLTTSLPSTVFLKQPSDSRPRTLKNMNWAKVPQEAGCSSCGMSAHHRPKSSWMCCHTARKLSIPGGRERRRHGKMAMAYTWLQSSHFNPHTCYSIPKLDPRLTQTNKNLSDLQGKDSIAPCTPRVLLRNHNETVQSEKCFSNSRI